MTRDKAGKRDQGCAAKGLECHAKISGLHPASDRNHQMCLTNTALGKCGKPTTSPAKLSEPRLVGGRGVKGSIRANNLCPSPSSAFHQG